MRSDLDCLVMSAIDAFEAIDVLAYVVVTSSAPSLADDADSDLERVVIVNLLGCARTIHAVMPVMKSQGRGSIVTVGSVAGEAGVMGIYSASKFGLRGLSDTVRRELKSWNVGVTLPEPGLVRSTLNPAWDDGLPGPEVVARAIVRAAVHPRRRVIVPWYYVPDVILGNALPWFVDAVFGDVRVQRRLNRDARGARATEHTPT